MVSASGLGNLPNSVLGFMAPTVQVTLTAANQRVHVTSSKLVGTSNGVFGTTASGLTIAICSQLAPNGPITMHGNGVANTFVGAGGGDVMTLSAVIGGTFMTNQAYNLGLCGNTNDGDWNVNGGGYTSAIVAVTP